MVVVGGGVVGGVVGGRGMVLQSPSPLFIEKRRPTIIPTERENFARHSPPASNMRCNTNIRYPSSVVGR